MNSNAIKFIAVTPPIAPAAVTPGKIQITFSASNIWNCFQTLDLI